MRSLIVMTMFAASLTYAAWNGYTEDRELELDIDGISGMEIAAGSGSLLVTGAADVDDGSGGVNASNVRGDVVNDS